MILNQNAKSMAAALALVGAIIVALNAVILPDAGRDMFPLSLGLLALAVLLWIWIRRDALAPGSDDAVQAAEEAAAEAEALAKRREVRRDVQPAASVEPDDLTRIKGVAGGYQRILNDSGHPDLCGAGGKIGRRICGQFSARPTGRRRQIWKRCPGRLSWRRKAIGKLWQPFRTACKDH